MLQRFFVLPFFAAAILVIAITANTMLAIAEDYTFDSPVCAIGFDPASITEGNGTALWWWSGGAETIKIDNGIGEQSQTTGFQWFYPTESKTYTATATAANGETATCSADLEVIGNKIEKPSCTLQIKHGLNGEPITEPIAVNREVYLEWSLKNASYGLINNGIGLVQTINPPVIIRPIEDIKYQMHVFGPGGSGSCELDIMIEPTVTWCQMYGPTSMKKDEWNAISWNIPPFVKKATIDNGIGELVLEPLGGASTRGDVPVSPQETTTYTLHAELYRGEVSCQKTIEVLE
jgi:hypothetical protein